MLTINIWELLWTVVNFFLLLFILRNLLYKPLVRFMDERQARIDAGLSAEKAAQERFDREQALFKQEQARLLQEQRSRRAAALEESRARKAREQREQSVRLRQQMKTGIAETGAAEQARFEENEAALAELFVDKLLCTDSPDGQQR